MDQKFIDIAKNELREDDLRKSQSLAQFRDWISKHPFLSEVRQGKTSVHRKLGKVQKNQEGVAMTTNCA